MADVLDEAAKLFREVAVNAYMAQAMAGQIPPAQIEIRADMDTSRFKAELFRRTRSDGQSTGGEE